MIIEIRKAGFVNKGAELMLYAIMDQLKKRYPDATFVMVPTHLGGSQPFHKLARLGFHPKASLFKFGIQWGDLAALLPRKLREMYGLILDQDVDIVLDAAGFSYSDQWGLSDSKELAVSSKRWRRNGTKVVLLPQAFGPYERPGIKPLVKDWVANVDLIFAREPDSYSYLTSLVGQHDKIKLFPDFTNLVEGTLPEGYDASDKRVALVPNYRMVDKTTKDESEAYMEFMIRCAQHLVKKNACPFVLVHEGEKDRMLAEKIAVASGGLPVVKEVDPLHIKGILGRCDATIGSRFHGLVSALSQGVPSLGTGWSHKYVRLFEDYDFNAGMISVLASDAEIQEKIDLLTNPQSADLLRAKLEEKSQYLKQRSVEMWQLVFNLIDKAAAER